MSIREDRRRYTRVDFSGSASMIQGDKHCDVDVIDISLKGILIATPSEYALDTDQAITLQLTLAGEACITMHVQLAHSSSAVLGFRCESIDMESMTHLRRLVELNLEDPMAADRVLDELMTGKPQ